MLLVQALGELILTEQTPVVPTAPPVGGGEVVVDVVFELLLFEQLNSHIVNMVVSVNKNFFFIFILFQE
ncbi:MAG: hypothetical protein ACRCZV_00305 [Sediminibacterium sp.]